METSFLALLFVFLFGILVGICLVGIALWYVLSFFLLNPDQNEQDKLQQCHRSPPTSATFQLPPVLLTKINDESFKEKENCWAFNLILYFLFRELRNSERIRRWILRKLAMEFDEILATSILGKFFSSITIQNIDMGQNFPVINWLQTTKVTLHPVSNCITTLDILVDLTYSGGFTFAIQAETHLKHSAFLSVKVKDVKGKARIQFTTEPYAHWSISFTETPDIDIDVASQLYGKSFSQITAIIAAQLKRSVRKKHTLPMFKIRYKPFFLRMEHIIAALLPQAAPQVQTSGSLSLTVVESCGLSPNLLQDNVYATVGIGDFDWVAIYPNASDDKTAYVVRDIVCVKTAKRETNLDFTLAQPGDIPVVDSVNPLLSSFSLSQAVLGTVNGSSYTSPELGLEIGDEIIAVDGKNVSTVKQCVKNFRNSTSMKVVWRVRRKLPLSQITEKGTIPTAIDKQSNLDDEKITAKAATTSNTENRNFVPEIVAKDNEESGVGYLSFLTPPNNRIHRICKTKTICSDNDPIFEEKFDFEITEPNRFLNITIWSTEQASDDGSPASTPSESPSKRSKNRNPLFPFGKDKVVACLSVPLIDIVSECSTTGMGFLVKDFYMSPPDGNAVDARDHSLKDHSGFDPLLCYGKTTLSFLYKSNDDVSLRKTPLTTPNSLAIKASEFEEVRAGGVSPSDESQPHQFVRTHFRSAAICDYCNKKIWLKEAYICGVCNMKCHKKCYERCLANTTCRKESYQIKLPSQIGSTLPPEIIMTHSESSSQLIDHGADNGTPEESESVNMEKGIANTGTTVRRRTLGGLISAVQSRSSQLRRVGSATALCPQSLTPNSSSKSLPPSPQTSPTVIRKAPIVNEAVGQSNSLTNPFKILDSGSSDTFEDDLRTAVDQLIANPNDDFVSLAKETGRDIFKGICVAERKFKLNDLLNRLQDEINTVSNERMAFEKEILKASPAAKISLHRKISACEEKVKALALLMLHFCAGLQQIQELEENEKEMAQNSSLTSTMESDENESEYSTSIGLSSNISVSTACLLEQDEEFD